MANDTLGRIDPTVMRIKGNIRWCSNIGAKRQAIPQEVNKSNTNVITEKKSTIDTNSTAYESALRNFLDIISPQSILEKATKRIAYMLINHR
jgi:hypothetical protein